MSRSGYKGIALAVAAAVLSSCSVMGHQKVEGWPALRVVEETVADEVMLARCSRHDPVPLACAEIFIDVGLCRITYSERFAPEWVKEHERLHCAGFDHFGSSTMQGILERHLQRKRAGTLYKEAAL